MRSTSVLRGGKPPVAESQEGTYKEATAASSWFRLGCIDEGAYCSGSFIGLRLRVRAVD
jgi:hypothetical protein